MIFTIFHDNFGEYRILAELLEPLPSYLFCDNDGRYDNILGKHDRIIQHILTVCYNVVVTFIGLHFFNMLADFGGEFYLYQFNKIIVPQVVNNDQSYYLVTKRVCL